MGDDDLGGLSVALLFSPAPEIVPMFAVLEAKRRLYTLAVVPETGPEVDGFWVQYDRAVDLTQTHPRFVCVTEIVLFSDRIRKVEVESRRDRSRRPYDRY